MLNRDIVYRGNVEIGGRIRVELMGERRSENRLVQRGRIVREQDDALLADVFTEEWIASA